MTIDSRMPNSSSMPNESTNENDEAEKIGGGGVISSIKKEKDWKRKDAYQAHPFEKEVRDSEDLREEWWDVDEQGEEHSCVGLIVADLLRWYFKKAGLIGGKTKLSSRYIWMAAKEFDELKSRPTTFIEKEGTTIKAALDVVRNYGVVTEDFFPFDTRAYMGNSTEFYARAASLKISSYYNLLDGLNGDDRVYGWKKWMCNCGPVIVRVNVGKEWSSVEKDKVLDGVDYHSVLDPKKGHAALLVGYNKKEFIVRNVWGKEWGNKGYVNVTKKYAINAFNEAYGILVPNQQEIEYVTGLGYRDSGYD